MTKQKSLNLIIIIFVLLATAIGIFSLIQTMPKAQASAEIIKYDYIGNSFLYGSGIKFKNVVTSVTLKANTKYFYSYTYSFGSFQLPSMACYIGYGSGNMSSNVYDGTIHTFYYNPSSNIDGFWSGNASFEFTTPTDLPNGKQLIIRFWNVEDTFYVYQQNITNAFLIEGGSISDYLNYAYSGSYLDGYDTGYSDGYDTGIADSNTGYDNGYTDGYNDGSAIGKGKNLFDYTADYSRLLNANFEFVDNGFKVTSLSTTQYPCVYYEFDVSTDTVYTLSLQRGNSINALANCEIWSLDNKYIATVPRSTNICTFNSGVNTIVVLRFLTNINTPIGDWAIFSNIQIEFGSIATLYVPYVSDINDLLQENYDTAYGEGSADGRAVQAPISYGEGYAVGNVDGKTAQAPISYGEGYAVGNSDGKTAQAPISYDEGYIQGNRNSSDNYDIGYGAGYNVGYSDGLGTSVGNESLGALGGTINAVFRTGFGAFDTIGSLEIFGIKIWALIALVVAVGLVFFILRIIRGH